MAAQKQQRQQVEVGTVFDMAACFVNVAPDGSALVLAGRSRHPNLGGVVIGAPVRTRDAPHGGELHPDGDELLYVISGHMEVRLDDRSEIAQVSAGQAFVIPQGTWHRVHVVEPSHVLHLTPGPNSRTRPRTPQGAL